MLPNIDIILKNFFDHENWGPFYKGPAKDTNADGELVPISYTVGYKFRYDGKDYGTFVEYLNEYPSMDELISTIRQLIERAVFNYGSLQLGNTDVRDLIDMAVVPEPLAKKDLGAHTNTTN